MQLENKELFNKNCLNHKQRKDKELKLKPKKEKENERKQ